MGNGNLTQTIQQALPPQYSIDFDVYNMDATASSGLPVTYSSSTPAVCTAAGNRTTVHATGICTITATQAGNATYQPAPDVQRNITIVSTPQTIQEMCPAGQCVGANLSDVNLSGMDLRNVNFTGTNLARATFTGARIDYANFVGANLVGVNFANVARSASMRGDIRRPRLPRPPRTTGTIVGANFTRARLIRANFSRLTLVNVRFNNAQLVRAAVNFTVFQRVSASGVNLTQASMVRSYVLRSNFPWASFRRANLQHTAFILTNLRGAAFNGASLRGTVFWRTPGHR